jgi:hypothetical protein
MERDGAAILYGKWRKNSLKREHWHRILQAWEE